MQQHLSYNDENDRAYGATGMAIGLMIYDGEEMLYSIDLDNEGQMMALSPDFYFAGNPGISAKSAWNQMLKTTIWGSRCSWPIFCVATWWDGVSSSLPIWPRNSGS